MLASSIPQRIQLPWGTNAGGPYIRSIPIPSQIGVQAGAASFNDGLPPLTMTPTAGGGVWPFGQDFNGIFNQLSGWARWQAAGGTVKYDATFATAGYTNGYPAGASVANATALGSFWLNLVDNNTSNPDTGGANWVSYTPVNLFGYDGGAPDAGSVTFAPVPLSMASLIGYPIRVKKVGSNNTGAYSLNINGLGPFNVIHSDGSTLAAGELPANGVYTVIWDGFNFQLQSTAQAVGVTPAQLQIQSGNSAIDAGTANALVATLAPVPISLASILGSPIRIKKSVVSNTGDVTINLNALGVKSILHADGSQILVGELPASEWFTMIWDGTNFILQSYSGTRPLGPRFIYSTGGTPAVNLGIGDCGKTVLCTSVGVGTLLVNLPSAITVGNGWWVRVRCVSALGDYATLDASGAETLDGQTARLFGQDTDVVVTSDGSNFFTASGQYTRYSAQITVSASSVFTFTHNLTPISGPSTVRSELMWICTSADAGYSVGDCLQGKLSVVNSVGATNTVSMCQDSAGSSTRVMTSVTLVAPNKGTTIATNLDYTKWKLVIRCEAD